MDQRTEVAVATELSLWKRALGMAVILGGLVLFSWLMAGTAHADSSDRPAQAPRGHGAEDGRVLSDVLAPKKASPESAPASGKRAAPEKAAPAPSTPAKEAPAPREARPTAGLEDQVAETGQQVREVTRPVTRAVTETLDRTPVATVTRAVTDTAGRTVQTAVREVRSTLDSTLGSTPVDPVLDVADGVARDLSGDAVAEPVASGESSTLVDESPSNAPKKAGSDVRRAKPVPDPQRRAAPPPPSALSDSLSQTSDRSADTALEQSPSAPTDPIDFAPPCAQSGAASSSAPGAAADAGITALDLRSAGHPVSSDPLVRVGGPSYEPGCSPD